MQAAALARTKARRRERRQRAAAHLEAEAERKAAAEEAARPSSLVRIGSLLPSVKSGDDSGSRLLLFAAGILLALVMASGSLLSVATRMMRGQVR